MATVNNPSLQGFSGKIDGHVAYTVGKKTYPRKLAISISNPRTEKQTAQRVKLTAAQTMYRAIRGSLLEKVHAIAAKEEERRSGYHGFLHANMNIFGQNNYIDYPRLVMSAGSLQLPFSMKATRCTPEELELAWLDNSSTVTAHPTTRCRHFRQRTLPTRDAGNERFLPAKRSSLRSLAGRRMGNCPFILLFLCRKQRTFFSVHVLHRFKTLIPIYHGYFQSNHIQGHLWFSGERDFLQGR